MKWRWLISWHLTYPLVKCLFHLKVEGRENIPEKGAIIIAPNHLSNLDPPMVGYAAKRELFYLAKEGLFVVSKPFEWLIRTFNAIPIKREGFDIKVFREVDRLIKRGQAIVIFPEGTRSKSGQLLPFKPGVGMIAARYGIPVVPCYIENTNKPIWKILTGKNPIIIKFGKPIECDKKKDKNYYEYITKLIESEVKKLKERR